MVSNPSEPANVSDGTYSGAYTLTTMPPGAAYAGAYFRAFLAVRGGLLATFYSAATDPQQTSLDSSNYVQAETRLVTGSSSPFTCATSCYAAARYHGFYKASGSCPDIVVASSNARTYIFGQIKVDAWVTAASGTITGSALNCGSKYVEIFHEVRKITSDTSHAIGSLLFLDTSSLGSSNLYAAYSISNTPVPLTVTQ